MSKNDRVSVPTSEDDHHAVIESILNMVETQLFRRCIELWQPIPWGSLDATQVWDGLQKILNSSTSESVPSYDSETSSFEVWKKGVEQLLAEVEEERHEHPPTTENRSRLVSR